MRHQQDASGLERAEMNEFDDLVSRRGVIMAGRLGPDGRVAEHKSESLFIENPAMLEMAHWFVAAVTTMLTSMGSALDQLTAAGTLATDERLDVQERRLRDCRRRRQVRGGRGREHREP